MTGPTTNPASVSWRAVASLRDVTAAKMQDIEIGRRVILLVFDGDQVLAFQGMCPHQAARLANGVLVDDTIQCPHHLARFRIADGTCTGGWQLPPLKRYAVKIEGDDIMISEPLRELLYSYCVICVLCPWQHGQRE